MNADIEKALMDQMLDGLSCAVKERAMDEDTAAEITLRIIDHDSSERAYERLLVAHDALKAEVERLNRSDRFHRDCLDVAITRRKKAEAEVKNLQAQLTDYASLAGGLIERKKKAEAELVSLRHEADAARTLPVKVEKIFQARLYGTSEDVHLAVEAFLDAYRERKGEK